MEHIWEYLENTGKILGNAEKIPGESRPTSSPEACKRGMAKPEAWKRGMARLKPRKRGVARLEPWEGGVTGNKQWKKGCSVRLEQKFQKSFKQSQISSLRSNIEIF